MAIVNYQDHLENNVKQYKGVYSELIGFLPDLSKLMVNLVNGTEMGQKHRDWILKVQGYYTIPDDIHPEQLKGPVGYLDDLFLTALVLKAMIDRNDQLAPLEDNWTGEIALMEVLNEIIDVGREEFQDVEKDLLAFVNISLD